MKITKLSLTSSLLPTKKNKIERTLIVVIVVTAQILHSTAIATDERITTYYWDGGWIEHASWTTSTLGEDLTIDIDAWNWPPEFSPLNVKLDNVITNEGLVDDFDDGIIDSSIWEHYIPIDPTSVTETGGVLEIDIPEGPSSSDPDQCQVGGVITKDFIVNGNFDVQVDFSVNPEYHITPNTNAKLFLTDQSGNSVEISIRSGHYLSVDLPLGSWNMKAMTPTNHLTGKLRITRTEINGIVEVDIDIKPQSCPNALNVKGRGILPVAILGSDGFDVSNIDTDTISLEGVPPLRSSIEDVATRIVDGVDCDCTTDGPDGFTDLTLKFDTQEVVAALGEVEGGQERILYLKGQLNDGTPIEGSDCIRLVSDHDNYVSAAIDECWQILEAMYATSTPSTEELSNWFDMWVAEGFLYEGRDAAHVLSDWLAGEGPGIGITFSVEIAEPMDVTGTSYVSGYWVMVSYSWSGGTGSFRAAMVFNGTQWLWYGDQMLLERVEFVPHAQMQTNPDGNVAFYTGFGITLWDGGLYAYNQGARSAIITGPGLPEAGQVLEHYYPEPYFRLYPKGGWPHPSGGWGLWLDDTAISSIPDNAVYTIGIYKETAETVSLSDMPLTSLTKTFTKGPMLNSELNASLFPTLTTPSSHDESILNVPGIVDVSWSNPSNMSVDFINLGLHSLDWSTEYQIMKSVTPGDLSTTLDTTSLPSDVRANQLYMHGTDEYGRRFGFGWEFF